MLRSHNTRLENAEQQYASLNRGVKSRPSRETFSSGSQYGTMRHHRSHSPSPCGAIRSPSLVHFHHPDLLPASTCASVTQPLDRSHSRSRGASQSETLPADLSYYTLYNFEPIEADTPLRAQLQTQAQTKQPPSMPPATADDVTFATGGQHCSRRDSARITLPLRALSPRGAPAPAFQLAILGLDPADRAVLRIAGLSNRYFWLPSFSL